MKTLCQPKIFYRCIGIVALTSLLTFCHSQSPPTPSHSHSLSSLQSLPVDEVWAGTGITYDSISVGPIVYVAYYDAERRFSVARVDTLTHSVVKKTLDSVFAGWDAHNSVVLAYDHNGYLHVSGNMHAVPLVYARTTHINDFNSLTQTNQMVGSEESLVTYPDFFFLSNGDLLFSYRFGKSGNGAEFINRFNGGRWSRLLSQPLFAPTSEPDPVNAYHTPYTLGPDGCYHVAWVWRKQGGAQKNFNVGYARSKDFIHWQDSQGRTLTLPITPANAEVVDAIPPQGGLFNNTHLGFDAEGKPVISYLKYDNEGDSQLYHARPRQGGWQIKQATDWKYRWNFSGGGTLVSEISFSGVRSEGNLLVEDVTHKQYGRIRFELDPVALSARSVPTHAAKVPNGDKSVTPSGPYAVRSRDIRPMSEGSVHGQIRWQTLPSDNNDKPRSCESVGLPSGCKLTSRLEIVHLGAH